MASTGRLHESGECLEPRFNLTLAQVPDYDIILSWG